MCNPMFTVAGTSELFDTTFSSSETAPIKQRIIERRSRNANGMVREEYWVVSPAGQVPVEIQHDIGLYVHRYECGCRSTAPFRFYES
jgi:hypothetical protein